MATKTSTDLRDRFKVGDEWTLLSRRENADGSRDPSAYGVVRSCTKCIVTFAGAGMGVEYDIRRDPSVFYLLVPTTDEHRAAVEKKADAERAKHLERDRARKEMDASEHYQLGRWLTDFGAWGPQEAMERYTVEQLRAVKAILEP